jgi:hypothetical protein
VSKHDKDIMDFCDEYGDEGILLADGFDRAFLGVGQQFRNAYVAVYDREECIRIISEQLEGPLGRDEAREQAEEYFDFNTQGAWVGEQTPIFIDRYKENEHEL